MPGVIMHASIPSFRSHAQFLLHFIINDEIRRGNVNIFGGVFKDIHIYIFMGLYHPEEYRNRAG